MNRAKILFTLLLLGIVAFLLTAQEPRLFGGAVDLRKMMTPDEFKGAGLEKLTPAEMENLNRWVEELLLDVREKTNKHVEAAATPSQPQPNARTPVQQGLQTHRLQ
jgi:hypothetical protein